MRRIAFWSIAGEVMDRARPVAEQDRAADDAARLRQQSHDAEAGHRLAGAGFADHGQGLTALEREGHAVDGLGAAVAKDEMGAQIVDREHHVLRQRRPLAWLPAGGHEPWLRRDMARCPNRPVARPRSSAARSSASAWSWPPSSRRWPRSRLDHVEDGELGPACPAPAARRSAGRRWPSAARSPPRPPPRTACRRPAASPWSWPGPRPDDPGSADAGRSRWSAAAARARSPPRRPGTNRRRRRGRRRARPRRRRISPPGRRC